MSLTIENLKFTIFGSGYDGTNNDSGTGGDIDPPTPPSPPMQGYLFRYGQMRPMEQYSQILDAGNVQYPYDTTYVEYTGGICRFKLAGLPKSGTLPSLTQVVAWIRSITNKSGGTSANANIGRLVPISRTDTGHTILGFVHFYMSDNHLYRHGLWCEYDPDVGHWDVLTGHVFNLSYAYDDVHDDNTMTFSIVNDQQSLDPKHFKIATHHINPQFDSFVGERLNLADYDFYLWS